MKSNFLTELSLDGDKGAPSPEGVPLGICDCQSYRVKAQVGERIMSPG